MYKCVLRQLVPKKGNCQPFLVFQSSSDILASPKVSSTIVCSPLWMDIQGLPPSQLVLATIPPGRCSNCPDLGREADSNPAGHPGSGMLSSWSSHPAEVPLPARAQAQGCGVPWPRWAGGRPPAQPGPTLLHQAHRQWVVCHSSLLEQFNKVVTEPAGLTLKRLSIPSLRNSPEKSTRAGHSVTTHCPGAGSSMGWVEMKCWAVITAWRIRICSAPS